jgi:rhamnose utilization protein RhaD (predicted bifunctional aldolase and dehydrogenase)
VAEAARPAVARELDRFSATLGRDPEQVQAAGGNTSVKADGVLWVKASGLWLADALERDVLVPVRLGEVLDGIRRGLADPVGGAVIAASNPEGLRPSIETTLHALLPHAVVVHTHSVRTIALAIREDAEALLAERLGGLAWLYVPYCKPGLPLTQAIAERLRGGPPVDVIVLGNHGLVVGGTNVETAAALLAEVERRLDAPVHRTPAGDPALLASTARTTGLREVRHAQAHGIATDPLRTDWAVAGSLYPDHVIFLGPAAAALPADDEAPAGRIEAAGGRGSKLFIAPDAGLLVASDTARSADELALCLALVLERVPDDARLRYLTAEHEAELLDWDAEKYRQSLARARATAGDTAPLSRG